MPGGNTQRAGGSGSGGGGGAQPSPSSINRAQRQAVLQNAVEMTQQIYSASPQAGQSQLNIAPRNVGLVKKFLIKITGTMNNTDGAATANLSDLGLSNLLTQVIFTDLNNNIRIQTAGWHLSFLQALKNQWPMTDALLAASSEQFSATMGNVFPVIVTPTGITHGNSSPFTMWYEVPLAYSDDDLRGAVYMNVVNATANLQLTLNLNGAFTAAGVDSTLAVWKGAAGTITGLTITVYQVYLDQLPVGKQGVVLPQLDLSTVYEIKNTSFSGFVATQDFPMPYANFRDFLSTFLIYNSNPAADAGRTAGTDINYLALQSANFTNIFKYEPLFAALKTRMLLGKDLPAGCYYFSSRRKPISTTTYGNMQLINNPITAMAGAYGLVGYEDFAMVNTLLNNSGSLAGGGQ
jgi:hypothetical protein